MRDAFGGTFMIQILLVFIIIYVGFIGIAINYGRAFRIKNYVIDYLEEHEISSLNLNASAKTELESAVKQLSISNKYVDSNNNICSKITESATTKCINGIVIEENSRVKKHGVEYVYYTVNTYIGYNLGFLNSLLSLGGNSSGSVIAGYFRISGETKVIVRN